MLKFKFFNFYLYIIFFKLFKLWIRILFVKRNIFCIYLKSSFYIHHIVSFLSFNSIIPFSSLMDITVIDYPERLLRFELIYLFWSFILNIKVIIKLFSNIYVPLLTLKNFFSSSLWLEREVWDMYGIKFLMHGDLRRILTDYNFKGFPLRKDYPLIGYVELRYDDTNHIIISDIIEISQEFRYFKFINPWNKWR